MKGTVLIVGPTGGVGSVVTQVLSEYLPGLKIVGVSRDSEKYERLNSLLERPIEFYTLDAGKTELMCDLLDEVQPDLLIHTGLPFENLSLMKACLRMKVNYLDTACYERKNAIRPRYRYDEQWNFHTSFEKAGITAVTGCGFDPGVTGAWVKDALDKEFREIHKLDILDCNGGEHGEIFRTNFNFLINMNEFENRSRIYRNGKRVYVPQLDSPNAIHQSVYFEEIGIREAYLIAHEELDSLAKHFPQIGMMRFWMTFGKQYIYCFKAFGELGLRSKRPVRLDNNFVSPLEFMGMIAPDKNLIKKYEDLLDALGMLSERPVEVENRTVIPIEFFQKMLPNPAGRAIGKTNISIIAEGISKDGKYKRYRRGQICDHEECEKKWGSNAVSGTTGVPAAAGADQVLRKKWNQKGVFNVEQLKPGTFLKRVEEWGLPMWVQRGDKVLKLEK